jgi:hypothetical protein
MLHDQSGKKAFAQTRNDITLPTYSHILLQPLGNGSEAALKLDRTQCQRERQRRSPWLGASTIDLLTPLRQILQDGHAARVVNDRRAPVLCQSRSLCDRYPTPQTTSHQLPLDPCFALALHSHLRLLCAVTHRALLLPPLHRALPQCPLRSTTSNPTRPCLSRYHVNPSKARNSLSLSHPEFGSTRELN